MTEPNTPPAVAASGYAGPSQRDDSSRTVLGVVLAVVLFVVVNLFAGSLFRGARADLTEQKLYTLSEGTRNIVSNLTEPITLRYFFPKSLMDEAAPGLVPYGERVQEMLEQYVAASDGDVVLEVLDPEPFSEAEELAATFGLQGMQATRQGERLYFGLVGTNSVDDEETIGFFDPRREHKLEYEVSELVERLESPDRKVVGLVTSIQLRGGTTTVPSPFGQPQQQDLPPWPILEAIERLFEVRDLDPAKLTEVPEDVDVLLLVQPRDLSAEGAYAIDQWALAGGSVLAFVDPFSFYDTAQLSAGPGADPGPGAEMLKLLSAWGVDADASNAVGDETTAELVQARGGAAVRLPLYFGVGPETLAEDDFLMESLQSLAFMSPMALRGAGDRPDGVEVTTLLTTTAGGGGVIPVDFFAANLDPKTVDDLFAPSGEAIPIGVRVSGTVRTAFPDGPPVAEDPEAEDPEAEETASAAEGAEESASEESTELPEGHLAAASAPFNAIVLGDVDMLHERMLFDLVESPFGMMQRQNSNATLVVGALESLGGSRDLIGLRGREPYSRPFEKKEELTRIAEEKFQAEEEELQRKLDETEAKLAELQSQKNPEDALLLSEEQQAELVKFQEQRIETRRALRRVKRDLRKDIDALGTRLKLLNVLALPLLLTLLVGSWLLVRRERRGRAKS